MKGEIYTMELETEITRKEINFINDIDLRTILHYRLKELDKIFLVNANYSTIFLAISTLEGILKHIACIYKYEIPGTVYLILWIKYAVSGIQTLQEGVEIVEGEI